MGDLCDYKIGVRGRLGQRAIELCALNHTFDDVKKDRMAAIKIDYVS